jgi:hypothetical protein
VWQNSVSGIVTDRVTCNWSCDNGQVQHISQYLHGDSSRQLICVLLGVLCFYVDKFSLSSGLCIAVIKEKIRNYNWYLALTIHWIANPNNCYLQIYTASHISNILFHTFKHFVLEIIIITSTSQTNTTAFCKICFTYISLLPVWRTNGCSVWSSGLSS